MSKLKNLLPQLPSIEKKFPKAAKMPELPNLKQMAQGPWGKGQGFWGIYAPQVEPMISRRKPKGQ